MLDIKVMQEILFARGDVAVYESWEVLKSLSPDDLNQAKQIAIQKYAIEHPYMIEQFAEFCEGL